MSTQPFVQAGEPLNDFLRSFWQRQVDVAEKETPDYRHPPLPLARIKKVMKSDPEVKVRAKFTGIIALFFFISEITARAFIIADANKRRTLSRSDIAKALSKSDQFDFLIDIVPRDDLPFGAGAAAAAGKKVGPSSKQIQASDANGGEASTGTLSMESTSGAGSEVLEQVSMPIHVAHILID
ncbi:hypothetical protein DXG03_005238 [Asterophora parasitica]|uniref:Transcription factor CBF/NF-Y/archaeal histone domain-containing protein n=1 Tax=Asterophora parasitica TaxID=117018 RepID=A0A9P7G269_9AGAR|nr:hypothetical protein DXG03_005238 [Asterophora parasitica]